MSEKYGAVLYAVRVSESGREVLGPAKFAPKPSCATCRWASDRGSHGWDMTLQCVRPNNPDEVDGKNSLAHWYEDLIVAPTFGCVQWEGK